MGTVRHVAAPVHPEALIIHFLDGRDLLEHACFPPCPHTHIFFQKTHRAHGMMRWVKGIWADRYGRAMASPEGPALLSGGLENQDYCVCCRECLGLQVDITVK